MIYFNINIRNPFWNRYKLIWFKHGKTFLKNKFWELQISQDDELLRLEFEYTIRQDHAGLRLEFGLMGYKFTMTIYDNRHWNYLINSWE